MSAPLKSCRKCNRLFTSESENKLCHICQRHELEGAIAVDAAVDHGLTNVSDIASATGLPLSKVLEIVANTSALRDRGTEGIICERCQRPTASADARLCVECRAIINQEIGEAATRMSDKLQREAEKEAAKPVGAGGMNVAHLTRSKRAATGMSRFNPTPRGKYG